MLGKYNYLLVVLSLLLAAGASFVALSLAAHIRNVSHRLANYWLICGGVSMGLGIWVMHFVGMIAFHLPIPVAYDIPLTLLSMLFAIGASILALATVNKGQSSGKYLYLSTFLMGSGVAAMHYIGMEALDMFPAIQYKPSLVVTSLVIAYAASFVALKLAFKISLDKREQFFSKQRFYASLVMGMGIGAMHYTGMAAAVFQAGTVCRSLSDGIDVGIMSILIVFGVIIILSFTFLVLVFDITLDKKDRQYVVTLETLNKELQQYAVNLSRENKEKTKLTSELTSYIEAIGHLALVSVTDTDGRIIEANDKFCEVSGYSREELLGQNHRILKSGEHTKDFFTEMWAIITSGNIWHREVLNRSKNGEFYWVDSIIEPIKDADGKIMRYMSIRVDITDRKRQSEEINKAYHDLAVVNNKLEQLSRTDALTKIANRRYFDETLKTETHRQNRQGTPLTLMICDIDYFKQYNDSYGHQAGDVCLQQVAESINSSFSRAGDLVARYGGEEFAVILPNVDKKTALILAERMRENIVKLALEHNSSSIAKILTLSIGVTTLVPDKDTSIYIIIKNADEALYSAKAAGRNNVQYSS